MDRAVNHLIGLDEKEESVYAVIPLSIDRKMSWFRDKKHDGVTAKKLCAELPALHHQHYVRSKKIIDYHMLVKINEACMMDTFSSPRKMVDSQKDVFSGAAINLPMVEALSYDFSTACRSRYSPGMDFVLKPIKLHILSSLLHETVSRSAYRNDLDQGYQQIPERVTLTLSTYNIEGLSNGMYAYDVSKHALHQIAPGDYRNSLQDGLLSDFVNIAQIPLSVNIAGNRDHYQKSTGYRGHRIQHMEAGLLSHHLILAASALNMGGHPVLGFDVPWYDDLHQLNNRGKTSLLQVPIGYYRPHPRLQGSMNM